MRAHRFAVPAVLLLLSACADKERSPFDPEADRDAPALVSVSVDTSHPGVYASWEASEPSHVVVEFEDANGDIYSAYPGTRDFATSGVVKLLATHDNMTYGNLRVRLRDRASNESRTPADTDEFTTGTVDDGSCFFFAMIDVGWGDSLYLEAPDGTNCLIDAGHPIDGPVVRRFLQDELQVTELKFASMTHVHEDHIGGFYGDSFDGYNGLFQINDPDPPLEPIFRVGTFIDLANKTPGTLNNPYSSLLEAIAAAGSFISERVELPPGASSLDEPALQWGEGVRVDLLAAGKKDYLLPDYILTQVVDSVRNNDSMVYRVQFGDFVILLMGDGEFATEQYLENHYPREFLQAQVLKLGHHGSNDANSERFLNVVDPIVGMIPNAVSENPGVEHPFVLNRLRNRGSDYFASDRVLANRDRALSGVRGDVLLYTDGSAFTVIADNVSYE